MSRVDRIVKAMDHPDNIRNIAICAHIDHGKTTFSDNLLFGAGMMSGELAGAARQLDFHEDEQERGITIDAASTSMLHMQKDKEFLINLIDTPGHVDFGGDVTRAMRAVDGAITLCCAVEGIMPQTETVLTQALRERVKPILFINKVDRLIKELQLTPEKMQERFVGIIGSVNKFIAENAPKEFAEKWQVNVADGSVCFGSAYHNWALSIPFMKERGITFKDIIDAYEAGGDSYKVLQQKAPIHECILDAVIKHLPKPSDASAYRIPKLWHGDYESEVGKSLLKCDPKGPLVFVVTKVEIDPQAGEIATGRMFSGNMKKGLTVFQSSDANSTGRIQQVFVRNGSKREIIDHATAGNIVGIAGLKSFPGDTISSVETDSFEELKHLFEPVITKAIEAEVAADLPKLIETLTQVNKEDPCLHVQINEETGEHLISGMGELHLEIIENRIKTEKNVKIKTSAPIVVYREAVTKPGEVAEGKTPNKHNKFYFKVEPMTKEVGDLIRSGEVPQDRYKKKDLTIRQKFCEAGMETKEAEKIKCVLGGNMLVDGTRGIVQINEVMELIIDMFQDVMKKGPLAQEPCVNVKVTLDDCTLHEDAIHRGPAQVYPAVREGIRASMATASPILFEPVQTMLFEAPTEYMGELSKLVANKRGQLVDMQQEGVRVMVKAKMPVGEMIGLSNELRSATGGRGTSSLIDQAFERLPDELQPKIVNQIRSRKGLN
ncbi:MAG: elongation factor 2 [Candidatus Woesearchaeota archaeon]|jgi:elongation factor 2